MITTIIEVRKNLRGILCENIFKRGKRTVPKFGSNHHRILHGERLFVAKRSPEDERIEREELQEYIDRRVGCIGLSS